MALIIKPRFTPNEVDKIFEAKHERIKQTIIDRLSYIGENFVINARGIDTYKDQTGNLRSSIGYVLYYNGQQIKNDFPGAQAEGVSKGTELADEIAKEFPNGFVIVCVAGMSYAMYVESRGFDVITNSSIQVIQDLEEWMEEFKEKLNRV